MRQFSACSFDPVLSAFKTNFTQIKQLLTLLVEDLRRIHESVVYVRDLRESDN